MTIDSGSNKRQVSDDELMKWLLLAPSGGFVDCHNRCYLCLHAEAGTVVNQHSRKLLLLGSEEVFKSSYVVPNDRQSVDLVGSGLRTVPSGPDPLHHNSRVPKKPQTP
ncbi:hypothetical protein FRX31_034174 [Thalictrum thalictroides]|uniref:Uncharacterized protein n=1 Tax=Thalictrum thalictroides TaxID=46969 RepID=A0A7J6UUK1_THATH|nr:hypothetical protein FRX31_034174 [Thalictrum thalictroides]